MLLTTDDVDLASEAKTKFPEVDFFYDEAVIANTREGGSNRSSSNATYDWGGHNYGVFGNGSAVMDVMTGKRYEKPLHIC